MSCSPPSTSCLEPGKNLIHSGTKTYHRYENTPPFHLSISVEWWWRTKKVSMERRKYTTRKLWCIGKWDCLRSICRVLGTEWYMLPYDSFVWTKTLTLSNAPGHDVTLYASYCNESVVNNVQYTSNITMAVSDATVMVILPWFKLLPTMLVPQMLKYLIVNYQGSFWFKP